MRVDILVGNVGSGKSTLARKIMNTYGSTIVNMDNLKASLSCGEYGRYDHLKKSVYHAVEETAIKKSLENGISVCIDRTNMDLASRKRFISIVKEHTDEIYCYDFGPGDLKELKRRFSEDREIDSAVWMKIYFSMQVDYVKPSINEGFKEIINSPKSFKVNVFNFDRTLVKNDFPMIGEIIPSGVEKLRNLYKDFSNIIVIWTCGGEDYERKMRAFLIKNKIPFDFINDRKVFSTDNEISAY